MGYGNWATAGGVWAEFLQAPPGLVRSLVLVATSAPIGSVLACDQRFLFLLVRHRLRLPVWWGSSRGLACYGLPWLAIACQRLARAACCKGLGLLPGRQGTWLDLSEKIFPRFCLINQERKKDCFLQRLWKQLLTRRDLSVNLSF